MTVLAYQGCARFHNCDPTPDNFGVVIVAFAVIWGAVVIVEYLQSWWNSR